MRAVTSTSAGYGRPAGQGPESCSAARDACRAAARHSARNNQVDHSLP